jgi:hypothetical protein
MKQLYFCYEALKTSFLLNRYRLFHAKRIKALNAMGIFVRSNEITDRKRIQNSSSGYREDILPRIQNSSSGYREDILQNICSK